VSKASDVQGRSPLASPQMHYHTQPGQDGNSSDSTILCTEHVGSSAASAPLAAATGGLAPQAQAVEGVHDPLRQQEAILAGDDTSGAPETAEVGQKRGDSADQSAVKKPGMGQGESPRLLASPDSSQAAVPFVALPSKRKMVAEPALESDARVVKKMSGPPESEAEFCGNGAGLATSLWTSPAEIEAKVSHASLHATETCQCLPGMTQLVFVCSLSVSNICLTCALWLRPKASECLTSLVTCADARLNSP